MAEVSPLRLGLEERQKQFKPGSIRRIKLTNFLTYGAVECFPGPRLNVVIGPNGTGKSTILCAICLGLGGQPPLLGRADDARTFIMHEKTIATIEIELAPFTKSNSITHTIKRTIDRNKGSTGKQARGVAASTYEINGQEVKLAQVQKLVSETYNIAIDNLCTFLPQDRVGSFSGFDAKDLLRETEKSVSGSGHLWLKHEELMRLESEMLNSDSSLTTAKAEVDRLEGEVKRLEREKELMEEREDSVKNLEVHEQKLMWVQFDEKRLAAVEIKKRKKELERELKVAQEGLEPLDNEIARLEHEYENGNTQRKKLQKELDRHRKIYHTSVSKGERIQDSIDEHANELSTIDSQKRAAELRVSQCQQDVDSRKQIMSEYPPMDEIQERIKVALDELREAKKEMANANKEVQSRQSAIKEAKSDYEIKQRRFGNMQDDKARRNENIFFRDGELGKIYEWVNANRNLFRRPVHGPIVCEISTRDDASSNYLEQHVKNTVLKSFVVECKEDMNLLFREVRQKRGLKININIVNQGTLEPVRRMYSDAKMQELKHKYDVLGYLDDSFDAPPAILQALRNTANVQSVLIGTSLSDSLERFLEEKENGGGKQSYCIFVKNGRKSYKHTAMKSRYQDAMNLSVDEVRPAKMLKPGVPPEEKDRAESDLQVAKQEVDHLQPSLTSATEAFEGAQRVAQEKNITYKDTKQGSHEVKDHQEKLARSKRKLDEAKREAAKDNKSEKKRVITAICSFLKKFTTEIENATNAYDRYMDATARQGGLRMSEDGLIAKKQELVFQLETMKQSTHDLEQAVLQKNTEFKYARNKVMESKEKADRLAPLGTDDNPSPLKLKFEEITGDRVELEGLISVLADRISRIIDNPAVLRNYKELKAQFDTQKEDFENLKDSKTTKRAELENLKVPYLAALTNIAKKVDELFGTYMAALGCKGEVVLHQGDVERGNAEQLENFKDWGIQIRVSFRDKSELQTLSAQVHSGGERSVSTIMYLMAMQDLMVSPFRCVDEINQGLDERNERLVFSRIVENSTSPPEDKNDPSSHCGQYFLITPKLLPNMTAMENEGVTVHCIFNGPKNFNHFSDWNVDRLLDIRRRELEDGGETESPHKRAKLEDEKKDD